MDGQYEYIWDDAGSGAYADFSAWKIDTVSAIQLSPNSFHSVASHSNLACCPRVLLLSQLGNGNDVTVLGKLICVLLTHLSQCSNKYTVPIILITFIHRVEVYPTGAG